MDAELRTESFIVRIWLEETAAETRRVMWRGHVIHAPGGERRYVKDLDELADFVAPYLEAMGVRLGWRWRLRRWLSRWQARLIGGIGG